MKTKISSVLLALVLAPNLFGQSKLNNQVLQSMGLILDNKSEIIEKKGLQTLRFVV